ncbi:hypothetical protein Ct9H90mP29_09840 [bacterium]|nr:MAG: hypothetical protein Ct9H90mP29_09840 [bacterium]
MKRIILILLLLSTVVFARKIVVKMGTFAPEGTDWHGMLIEMGQQWKSATKGKVQLRKIFQAVYWVMKGIWLER